MKIEIYQINLKRDKNKAVLCCWLSDKPRTANGDPIVDSSIYDCVFEGDVKCENLSEVYRMFQPYLPDGYMARPIGLTDIVKWPGSKDRPEGFYFKEKGTFTRVAFDSTLTKQSECFLKVEHEDKITVLVVEPGKKPYVAEIDNTLEAMQKVVGGHLETFGLTRNTMLVLNAEGKLAGLPLNRALRDEGKIVDIVAGTFFVVGNDGIEEFTSLSCSDICRYSTMFAIPESFSKNTLTGEISIYTQHLVSLVNDDFPEEEAVE